LENKKVIKVLEPHGGWLNLKNQSKNSRFSISELDSGFVNRLIHWRSAYLISKIHNFEYEIQVEYLQWPELRLIELPNTKAVCDFSSHTEYLDYKTDFLKWGFNEEPLPIKKDMINDIIFLNKKLLNNNHYFANYPFNWDEYTDNNDILKFPPIKFKYDFIEKILKNHIKNNYVGVHIRRGNGTTLPSIGAKHSNNGITSIIKESDMNIVGWREINKLNVNNTPYLPDSYYFNYMDSLIFHDESVKFFVSYDIPYRFIKKFKDRYDNRIITSDDFLHEIEYELYKKDYRHDLADYKNVINTVIDLFSLSMCSTVIMNPISSWGLFLKQYKNMKEPTYKSII
jgi:hypothetical protein